MGRIIRRGSIFKDRDVEDPIFKQEESLTYAQILSNIGNTVNVANALYGSPMIHDAAAGLESLFSGSPEEKAEVTAAATGVEALELAAKSRAESAANKDVAAMQKRRGGAAVEYAAEEARPPEVEELDIGIQVEAEKYRSSVGDPDDPTLDEGGNPVLPAYDFKDQEMSKEFYENLLALGQRYGVADPLQVERLVVKMDDATALQTFRMMQDKKDRTGAEQLHYDLLYARIMGGEELDMLLHEAPAKLGGPPMEQRPALPLGTYEGEAGYPLQKAAEARVAAAPTPVTSTKDELRLLINQLGPVDLRGYGRNKQGTDKISYETWEQARRLVSADKLQEAQELIRKTIGAPPPEVIAETELVTEPTGPDPVVTETAETAAITSQGLGELTIPHGVSSAGLEETYRKVAATIGETFNTVRPNLDALLTQKRLQVELMAIGDSEKRAQTLALMAQYMQPEGVTGLSDIPTDIRGKTVADAQAIAMDIAASNAPDQAKSRAIRELLAQAGDLSDVRSRYAASGGTLGYHHEGSAQQAILNAYSGAKPKVAKPPTAGQQLAWLKEMGITPGAKIKQAIDKAKLSDNLATGSIRWRNQYLKFLPGYQKFLKTLNKANTVGGTTVVNDLEELREETLQDTKQSLVFFNRQKTNAETRIDNLKKINLNDPPNLEGMTDDLIIQQYGADLRAYRAAARKAGNEAAAKVQLRADVAAALQKQKERIAQSTTQLKLVADRTRVLRLLSPTTGSAKRLSKEKYDQVLQKLEEINQELVDLQSQ